MTTSTPDWKAKRSPSSQQGTATVEAVDQQLEGQPRTPRRTTALCRWRVEKCRMWWARPTDLHPEHLTLLDATERERHIRYLRDEDRNRFAVGVVLSRLILSAELGIAPQAVPIDRTCADCGKPHGAPRLPDGSGPYISVSHSGDRIAVAMSLHGPLGVDVEATDRHFTADLARHVLSEAERTRGETDGLAMYWTRKEAVLKATGDGLRMPMTGLTLSGPEDPPRLLAWDARADHIGRITMHTLDPGPGYAACLALVDQPCAQVREEQATDLLASWP